MKKILTSVLVTAAMMTPTAALAAVPEGQLAVTTSPLTISTTSTCATLPLTWTLTSAPAGVTSWSVDGDIVDAAGASRGSIFEYERLPVTQAGEAFQICNLPEGVSTFNVAADIDAWTADYTTYSTRFLGTLTVTRTTPPPPVIEQDKTRVTWVGKPSWEKWKSVAQLDAKVNVKSECYDRRGVSLMGQRRPGGPWKKLIGSRLDSGRVEIAYPVKYIYKRVRIEVAETLLCEGATSRSLVVPKKPAV